MHNITTPEMKYYVLSYFRFQRQFPIVATEVNVFGSFVADVLASDHKEFIEAEIKISESDMIADFQHKSEKHTAYLDSTLHKTATLSDKDRKFMPNKFYYAVPYHLARFALSQVRETPYGLIYVNPDDPKLSMNSYVKVLKHPQIINRTYPKDLEHRAIMRATSELINMYESLLDI